jgi:hypothetical protein
MEEIYGSDGEHIRYGLLSKPARELLDLSQVSPQFIATFLKEAQ